MPPKKDTTTKGDARVGKAKGSRLAFDDTKQEVKRGRGRPRKVKADVEQTKATSKAKAPPQSKGKGTGGWMAHVKKTWEAGKKKNPSYSYKSAMSDAKKTYKK